VVPPPGAWNVAPGAQQFQARAASPPPRQRSPSPISVRSGAPGPPRVPSMPSWHAPAAPSWQPPRSSLQIGVLPAANQSWQPPPSTRTTVQSVHSNAVPAPPSTPAPPAATASGQVGGLAVGSMVPIVRSGSAVASTAVHGHKATAEVLREFAAVLFAKFPDIDAAFTHFDNPSTGKITAVEFQAAAESIEFAGDGISVFHALDNARNGFLSRREFGVLVHWNPAAAKQALATSAGNNLPSQSMSEAYPSIAYLPRERSLDSEVQPSAVQFQADQDISSIQALSPLSHSEMAVPELQDKAERQEILDSCKDYTTKLVNQLAAVLKGLEADVDSLRRENRSLRKTVAQGLPGGLSEAGLSSHSGGPGSPAAETPSQVLASGTLSQPRHASPRFGPAASQASASPRSVAVGGPGPSRNMGGQLQTPSSSPDRRMLPAPNGELPQGPITPPHTEKNLAGMESTQTILRPMPQEEREVAVSPHPEGSQQTATPPYHESSLRGERIMNPVMERGVVQYVSSSGNSVQALRSNQAPAEPAWAVDQTIWLGSECNEQRFIGKARLLARDTIASVTAAVEGLNRGTLRCPEDFCVVYSENNRGFYMLFRQGLKEQALDVCFGPDHDESSRLTQPEDQTSLLLPAPDNSVPLTSASSTTMSATLGVAPDGTQVQMALQKPGSMNPQTQSQQRLVPSLSSSQLRSAVQSTTTLEASAPGVATAPPVAPMPMQPAESSITEPELTLDELCRRGEAEKAEELLALALRSNLEPTEANFDSVIQALAAADSAKGTLKSEEWLWRAMDLNIVPHEASFSAVVRTACEQGLADKAEDVLLQMLHGHVRMRPSKEIFDVIIRMFAERCDAPKVEEWLLNAGQSGWTPEQAAFVSVVQLYAQVDSLKAEEWLSRAQQTEYRLPADCFESVIRSFTRTGNAAKTNDWLSRMLSDERMPSESTLQEATALLIDAGDVSNAEAWLTHLASRSNLPLDDLYLALFETSMVAGDLSCAERQLATIRDADPMRTQQVVMAWVERGDAPNAKASLERYRSLGGAPTPEIHLAMLQLCVPESEAEDAEAIARSLAAAGKLTRAQAPLLQHLLGDERCAALLRELGVLGSSEVPAASGKPAGRGERTRQALENSNESAGPPHRTGGAQAASGVSRSSAKASAKGPPRRSPNSQRRPLR